MNLLQQFRYKTKMGIWLAVLLCCLLLNNILNQARFGSMEKAAIAIYEDRLLPSTYIFEIREYLYKERALVQSGLNDKDRQQRSSQYRIAIMALLDKYEHTTLTQQEMIDWQIFKSNLNGFLTHPNTAPDQNAYFEKTVKSLSNLLLIQSGEGKHLKTNMTDIVRVSTLTSYVEAGLLIIIGCITLSLIGFSKNVFNQKALRNPSLN